MKSFIVILPAILMMGACDETNKTDAKQAVQQEALAAEANAQVGMPGITNFTEKRMVRKLYELRDSSVATFSYVMDMNGRLFHVCDSVGFALPYGVQFTSPEKDIYATTSSSIHHNMPQSEPNGLFMPSTAEGTWIMCAGAKGAIDPIYVEPRVIVSTHKMHAFGDWQDDAH